MTAREIPISSGLWEELSSFDGALWPRHEPVAQRVRALDILKGKLVYGMI